MKDEIETFEVTVSLDVIHTGDDFKKANELFFREIEKRVHEGRIGWQILESGCWIKSSFQRLPYLFYDLRDRAVNEGWLKEWGIGEKK